MYLNNTKRLASISYLKKFIALPLICLLLPSCALWNSELDDTERARVGNAEPVLAASKSEQVAKQVSCAIEANAPQINVMTASLQNLLEQAHNDQAETITLPVEMMFSLYYGLMVPGHSAEVGKEFSLIYSAKANTQSPTLNKQIDYSVFSTSNLNEGNRCFVPQANMALYRVLMYADQMSVAQWHELRKQSPKLYSELLHLKFSLRAEDESGV